MKHILKYFFSFCFMLTFFLSVAQETNGSIQDIKNKKNESKVPETTNIVNQTAQSKIDTIVPLKKDRYGIRIGADLYKLSRGFYDKNYKGLELVADYRLSKKYYAAVELGSENKTTDDIRLNSTTKGTYLKIGFDYNGYTNWLDMENIISIGLRGGFSTFNQKLNSYNIYNANPYWGEMDSKPSGEEFKGLTAGWIEVVAGLKVEVYNNIFVGFSLRMNTLIFDKEPSINFENLYIPGFNRTYAGNFGAGFNYTITYFVPLYKKIIKPKEN